MTFEEYQKRSRKTAIYPNLGTNYIYPVLGLSGEVGEVAEKVKKLIRDKNGIVDPGFKTEITKELGDVLWYVSNLGVEFGIDLEEIVQVNLDKLSSRMKRNQLRGSGDNR